MSRPRLRQGNPIFLGLSSGSLLSTPGIAQLSLHWEEEVPQAPLQLSKQHGGRDEVLSMRFGVHLPTTAAMDTHCSHIRGGNLKTKCISLTLFTPQNKTTKHKTHLTCLPREVSPFPGEQASSLLTESLALPRGGKSLCSCTL